MEASLTPRQIAKRMLNGESPPRPLLLPIVFSLGAKIENVPLGAFLSNPTKIVNAARQMRNHLQTDGAACYFDPYLEVEALGATLQRRTEGDLPGVQWKHAAKPGEMPEGLRSPEEAAKCGRIPVAAEVIRRMNAVPNRDFLLMASVGGPLALAAMLTQTETKGSPGMGSFSSDALEFAASVDTQVVKTYLEAGADTIFIHEALPADSAPERFEDWAGLLSPTINLIRFYEALPVLQVADTPALRRNWETIRRQPWECVICAPASVASLRTRKETAENAESLSGMALPPEIFLAETPSRETAIANCRSVLAQSRPAVITTAGDVPFATDMKHLKKVFEEIVRRT
ncbi:MAG TPA: uroporphyrinogen decarboxylase family protein [Candidatus Angelobacter sp.]|nr:uroporphyrinogen decarboxylase family protein [Candidatus Angelobacter sp.]